MFGMAPQHGEVAALRAELKDAKERIGRALRETLARHTDEIQALEGTRGVIRASSFTLVDAGGTVRGHFRLDPDGSPALTLYDEDGRRRGSFGLRPDGTPRLAVLDESGRVTWRASE